MEVSWWVPWVGFGSEMLTAMGSPSDWTGRASVISRCPGRFPPKSWWIKDTKTTQAQALMMAAPQPKLGCWDILTSYIEWVGFLMNRPRGFSIQMWGLSIKSLHQGEFFHMFSSKLFSWLARSRVAGELAELSIASSELLHSAKQLFIAIHTATRATSTSIYNVYLYIHCLAIYIYIHTLRIMTHVWGRSCEIIAQFCYNGTCCWCIEHVFQWINCWVRPNGVIKPLRPRQTRRLETWRWRVVWPPTCISTTRRLGWAVGGSGKPLVGRGTSFSKGSCSTSMLLIQSVHHVFC